MIVLGAAAPKPRLAIPPPGKLGGILANLLKATEGAKNPSTGSGQALELQP